MVKTIPIFLPFDSSASDGIESHSSKIIGLNICAGQRRLWHISCAGNCSNLRSGGCQTGKANLTDGETTRSVFILVDIIVSTGKLNAYAIPIRVLEGSIFHS